MIRLIPVNQNGEAARVHRPRHCLQPNLSIRDSGAYLRKVDIGLCNVVDVAGQNIQRCCHHDFDDAGVVESGRAQGRQIGIVNMTAGLGGAVGEVRGRRGRRNEWVWYNVAFVLSSGRIFAQWQAQRRTRKI